MIHIDKMLQISNICTYIHTINRIDGLKSDSQLIKKTILLIVNLFGEFLSTLMISVHKTKCMLTQYAYAHSNLNINNYKEGTFLFAPSNVESTS